MTPKKDVRQMIEDDDVPDQAGDVWGRDIFQEYKLVGREAVPCSTEEWAQTFGEKDRIIAQDEICGTLVSTVFLGLDHSYGGGPPLLFETMWLHGEEDRMWRCSTYDQAEKQHQDALMELKAKMWAEGKLLPQ